MRRVVLAAVLALAAMLPARPGAADVTRTIAFERGADEDLVAGRLRGEAGARFLLRAEQGQRLHIDLWTSRPIAHFVLIPPGSRAPIFRGQQGGRVFSGIAPASGDYAIEIHLAPAAARRGERVDFELVVRRPVPAAASAPHGGDFADGLAGGPDLWAVTGISPGDHLNLRAEPSPRARVLRGLPNGALLRNRGCAMRDGQRWCRVEMRDDASVAGWVAGRFLKEP